MKEMKTRKTYERPSMRVVVLKHSPRLLQASQAAARASQAGAEDYQDGPTWDW